MDEFLTFREKVELLGSVSPLQFKQVCDRVPEAIVEEDNAKNRIICRRDVRTELALAIEQSGLTNKKVAQMLGIQFQNLSGYIHGRTPLPLKTVEEILFLLDGKMTRE